MNNEESGDSNEFLLRFNYHYYKLYLIYNHKKHSHLNVLQKLLILHDYQNKKNIKEV